jgi:hypothetical protein
MRRFNAMGGPETPIGKAIHSSGRARGATGWDFQPIAKADFGIKLKVVPANSARLNALLDMEECGKRFG